DMEDAFLAAKVLATMDAKEESLDVLLEVIHLPANKNQNGGLVSLLEEFDLSEKFVDLFRIYLFGNFKASALAKNHLDYTEFDINSRTLKKAEKHWNHFLNNATNDDAFELRKEEAGTILQEIRELLQEG
ncbi:MAG: HEAT repeat domain-containing protein, partial [Cyclobacteriaceae bacterium]